MLQFIDLSLRRGTRQILSNANFVIHAGQKVGVTGANGAGKSSLLALILGELAADLGTFERPAKLKLAHVAQELPAVDTPACDYVVAGDEELAALHIAIERASAHDAGQDLAQLYVRLENIDGYTARPRAAAMLHGLGFKPAEIDRPLTSFSGGWRMRLNLARALMCRSDLLLLDEPTNHLDLDAVFWLQDWLREYRGTLLLISHDRDFLDDVVDHVLHIENADAHLFTGNYSDIERQRSERLAQQQAQFAKQQRERAHMQLFVDRFRAQATKARQAQSRIKALERMALIAPAHVDSPFHFAFPPPGKLPRPLLQCIKVDLGYGAQPVLEGVTVTLLPGDRVGLVGANGAGKSTLVKALAGELAAKGGEWRQHPDTAIGYFAQHQLEQLQPESGALAHFRRLDKTASEQTLRNFIGGFGFNGDDALAPVERFSGGEKARLVLAMLVYQNPNLLLLDEPTNHLDLEMRHALTVALQDYQGALVVVSHDRHLLRTVTDSLWYVSNGRVELFDGDLDDYHRVLAERAKNSDSKSVSDGDAKSRKDVRRLEAQKRAQTQPLRDSLKRVEARLEKLGEQKKALEAALSDTSLYEDANKDRLRDVLRQQTDVTKALAETEEQWLEASDALEKMEKN